MGFLQIVLGYLLARIVISVLFLPQYFRGEMFTAYELMRRRFGERIRKLTASIFLSRARWPKGSAWPSRW
jgi:SSS family solute:Na+ symporter